MHGYEVIGALEARSGGRWRPSAGSVYPTLQLLADEGLVTSEELDGKRVYSLTPAGRAAVATGPAPEPWTAGGDGGPDLREAAMGLMGAVAQVERVGSIAARGEALRILTEARRRLYGLLASDDPAVDEDPTATEADPA
jgi:DNA-binding PadR family transcriptional regulator